MKDGKSMQQGQTAWRCKLAVVNLDYDPEDQKKCYKYKTFFKFQ